MYTRNRTGRILLAALVAAVAASASMSADSVVIRARALLDRGLAVATRAIDPVPARARPTAAVAPFNESKAISGAVDPHNDGVANASSREEGVEAASSCGNVDELACFPGFCNNDGLVVRNGICREISPCGGEGQRACTAEEGIFQGEKSCEGDLIEIPGCTGNCYGPGLFDSSGTCVKKSDCGGKGQRACTISEQILPCNSDDSLIEVLGCSGDCFAPGGASIGMCTKMEDIPEPTTNATPSASSCSLSGWADMHMHLFAHLAHGGGALAGKPYAQTCDANGDNCVDDGVNEALKPDFTTDLDLVNGDGTESGTWGLQTTAMLFQNIWQTYVNFVSVRPDLIATDVQVVLNLYSTLLTIFPCPDYMGSSRCTTEDYFHGPHDPLLGDPIGSFIGTKDGATSNLGKPLFNGWPKWTSTTHQQAYYVWLERAWQGGLRLMTQFAVTNEALCRGNKHVKGVDCTKSMASIDDQIKEAYRFQDFIDRKFGGAGNGWFRIVKTPLEARLAVARGKLAVVLGIETAELFNCYDPETSATLENPPPPCSREHVSSEVDRYYDMGIRHIFPVHNFDNAFGAAATWQDGIEEGQRLVEGAWWTTDDCRDAGYGFKLGGFTQTLLTVLKFTNDIDPYSYPNRSERASCNHKGLTDLGRYTLLDKLKEKGMLIDVDHMSAKAFDQTLTWAEGIHYPVVASHVLSFERHVQDVDGVGTRHERLRTEAQLQRIKGVGGMIAAMLKDDAQDTGNKGKKLTIPWGRVYDDCRHSSKTFAHAFEYAADVMGDGPFGPGRVALGSDFNGVAGHIGPRFGTDACGGPDNPEWFSERNAQITGNMHVQYPFTLTANGKSVGVFDKQVTGHRTFDYNYDGMAHVGMLPDFIQDLRTVGLSEPYINALFGSAEEYIKVWERATKFSSMTDDKTPDAAVADTCAYMNPDITAPILTVPDDMTLEATSSSGRVVSFSVTASHPLGVLLFCSDQFGRQDVQREALTYPIGTTQITCSAVPDVENPPVGSEARASFTITIFDAPPTIAAHGNIIKEAAGPDGAQVTYESPLYHDVVDGSSATSCSPSSGSTFQRGVTVVNCAYTDRSGNTATSSFNVRVRDTIAPVITPHLAPTPNQAGWNKGPGPVFVDWGFSDVVGVIPDSRTADCFVTEVQSDGETSLTCSAKDEAGNVGSATVVVKLDRTAPVITFSPPSTPANANGWHRADVHIPYTITDATSGIPPGAPTDGTVLFTTDGTGLTSTVTATDVAGNVATLASPPINLDKTPPTITASRAPAANVNGWNNTNVTVSFACQDALSGVDTCTAGATMTTEGANQSRAGVARDKAGNEASTSIAVSIDKTPPLISGTPDRPPNGNNWYNADVTVSFICSDALSGVGACGPTPQVIREEGTGLSRSGSATDLAGNTASTTVGGINLDKTPPVLACSNDVQTLWSPNHELVAVTAAVTVDGGVSGAAGFTLLSATSNEPDNGLGDGDTENDVQGWTIGTPDTSGLLRAERSSLGTGRIYTLSYRAFDLADNVGMCTTTVSVPNSQK